MTEISAGQAGDKFDEGSHPMGRRGFLRMAGVGALAISSIGAPASASKGTDDGTRGTRYAMVVDLRRCIGCHACSVACKAEFGVPLGVWRSWVKQAEQGPYPNTQRFFLPRLCNHCDHPPCVEACPTTASWKRDDGFVLIREERCIGCRLCIAACPYDARFLHPDERVAQKCTFCVHRVDEGLVPACVNTCQGNARIFGDLNDPDSEVARLVASQPTQVIKPEMGTHPSVFYIAANQAMFGRIS